MTRNNCNHTETRREDWGTPRDLFHWLDSDDGCGFNFAGDLAADGKNALCWNYISKERDFLSMGYQALVDYFAPVEPNLNRRWLWCNPPYGKSGCGKWVKHFAYFNAFAFGFNIIALIPASVGAKWFSTVWETADAVVFIGRRLKFDGAPDGAQFDSALAIWGGMLNKSQLAKLRSVGHVVDLGKTRQHWRGDEAFARAMATHTEHKEG